MGCDTLVGKLLYLSSISTHTSRVGCDLNLAIYGQWYCISTHTSRVGCDLNLAIYGQWYCISTHTSRVGCDVKVIIHMWNYRISTHTSRVGCDSESRLMLMAVKNFYSHIPCGMWRIFIKQISISEEFLLTHPVWDVTLELLHEAPSLEFLLTHPVWDVTHSIKCDHRFFGISTHTSRVGCDSFFQSCAFSLFNFYSHIPCGMWQLYIVYFNHIIPIYYRMDL